MNEIVRGRLNPGESMNFVLNTQRPINKHYIVNLLMRTEIPNDAELGITACRGINCNNFYD